MFKKILIVLVVALAAFAAYVATRPADFTITRSASMAASPAKVFGVVNDLHQWNDWSPWAKLDPDMKTVYEGPSKGVGAISSWTGNNKVGEGKMTLVKSEPNSLVSFQLEFLKPMKANNTVDFSFKPEGKGTLVTWTMSGKNSFVGKAFCAFMNMDKMVGGDFESGLANLKALVEAKKK